MEVSAYIPCYNNAPTLQDAIRGVQCQTIRPGELFVVDDASTDGSPQLARSLGVRVIQHSVNLGRGAVRARAMVEAQGALVLCCDATNVLPRGFVELALPWFSDQAVAAVFGPMTQPSARNGVERWRGRHLFKMNDRPQVNRSASLAAGGAIVRKDQVLGVGNFNRKMRHSEDRELGEKLLAANYAVVLDPELKVVSVARNSLFEVLERYWRWYAGPEETMSWKAYVKEFIYSVKVMAIRDLRDHDLPSVLISLFSPHYRFWRSWRRVRGKGGCSGANAR